MSILFLLAVIALLVGTAAIYMAMIKPFPVEWLYYHYHIRKPVVWSILGGSLLWELWSTITTGSFRLETLVPIGLMGLAVILAYRMHQEIAFPSVNSPPMADDPSQLHLTDDMLLAIIEYEGVTKAYPLDYVIHHHIVKNETINAFFVAMGDTVNAFRGSISGKSVDLTSNQDGTLFDQHSETVWDARGKYKSGLINSDLEMLAVSDEYWFSWKAFHPSSQLIRLQ
jgi:hypothetical protein